MFFGYVYLSFCPTIKDTSIVFDNSEMLMLFIVVFMSLASRQYGLGSSGPALPVF